MEDSKQFQGRTALDNLLEGVHVIGFDWKYLYANKAMLRDSNTTEEKLIGFTVMEKVPGIEKTDLFKVYENCMASRTAYRTETEFNYPDGSVKWLDIHIQPIPEGLITLSLDITERKTAEIRRKEYTEALEEMMFMTSHEVRHPITQIMGIATLLDGNLNTKEEVAEIVGFMKDSVHSLDEFTKKLTSHIHNRYKEKN